jgi:hypothetical protein
MKNIILIFALALSISAIAQDKKISELDLVVSLDGTEDVPIVKSSTDKRVKVSTLRPVTSVFGRTGAINAASGDYSSFYPLLSESYTNPSWITSLPWSKITSAPSFLTSESDPVWLTDKPDYLTSSDAASMYQSIDGDLTAISALTGTGYAKRTASNTWSLDNSTFLTGNENITLSGDISGSGATAITTTIGAGKVTNSMLAGSIAASKLIGTDIATVGTITTGTWTGTAISNSYLANSSISFASGTSGSDVNWSSSPVSLGGTSTLNIPDAGSSARGLVTTGTQTFAGAKTFTGTISAANFSGSSSGTNTGDQTSVTGNAGTATALQNARTIYGNSFDGTANLTQVIASTYGGTGNGFTKFSGPATSEKTFTLPNASATLLYDGGPFGENITVAKNQNAITQVSVTNTDVTNSTSMSRLFVQNGTTRGSVQAIGFIDIINIGSESNSPVSIRTNSTNRIRISAAGNVSIGSSSDATNKLEVTGNISATGTVTGSNLSGTNTGDQTITLSGDATGSGTSAITVSIADADASTRGFVSTGNQTFSGVKTISSLAPPIVGARTSSTTNTILAAIRAQQITTADMVDGFGSSIVFDIQDNASVSNQIARIGAIRNGADNTGKLAFYTNNAGTETLRFSIDNSGNGVLTGNISAANFSGSSSGTNTGDQTITITGDVTASGSTGALSATVTKINGTSLAGLATGILKNTTSTGVPSIATSADFPAAGSDTYVQFNNSSTFGGSANLTWSNSTNILRISGEDNSIGVSYPLVPRKLRTSSTGFSPGMGVGISMQTEVSDGVINVGSTIESVSTDVTSSSEDFDLIFKTQANGGSASEKLRLSSQDGVSTTQATVGNKALTISSTATNDDPTITVYQNRLATTDATVTTIHTIAVPSSTTLGFKAFIVARRTGGASGTAEDGAMYEVNGVWKNVAGTATSIGGSTTVIGESQAGWDVTQVASAGNVLLKVTGASANNVTWHLSELRVFQVGQ